MGFSGLVFFGADHSVQDGEVAGGILGFFWFRVYGSGLAQDDEVAGGRGGQLPNGLMRSLLGRREHQGGSPKTSDRSTPVQDDEVAGGRRGELPRALRVAEALVQLERDALRDERGRLQAGAVLAARLARAEADRRELLRAHSKAS